MQTVLNSLFENKAVLVAALGVAAIVAVALLFLVYRLIFARGLRVPGAGRSRQPRLGIVDDFNLDGKRHLVLVRRDNVEHLLMIGGPNDVLIESAIVRTQAIAAREPPLAAASAPAAPILAPAPPPAPQAPVYAPPPAAIAPPDVTFPRPPALVRVNEPIRQGEGEPRPSTLPRAAPPRPLDADAPVRRENPAPPPVVSEPVAAIREPTVTPPPLVSPPEFKPPRPPLRQPLPPLPPRAPYSPPPRLGLSAPLNVEPVRSPIAPLAPFDPNPPRVVDAQAIPQGGPAAPAATLPSAPQNDGPGGQPSAPKSDAPKSDAPPLQRGAEPADPKELLDSLEEEMAKLLGRPSVNRTPK